MPQCRGARIPVKQWGVCDCSVPGRSTLWAHIDVLSQGSTPCLCLPWYLSAAPCSDSTFGPLPLVLDLHPASSLQRSPRVSGDPLRAESRQHPPLTGGQMLPAHAQTNRHQPDGARAQMAEQSSACWRPSHKLAMSNRGPLLAALGQDKVTPVCSPQEL